MEVGEEGVNLMSFSECICMRGKKLVSVGCVAQSASTGSRQHTLETTMELFVQTVHEKRYRCQQCVGDFELMGDVL